MIIFLYGKDGYRSRQHVQKMQEKFIADRDPQELNTQRVSCKEDLAESIMGTIYASPFLAEKRMVVLDNCISVMPDDFLTMLTQKINDNAIPASTVLVFWESGDVFKKKTQKTLATLLAKQPYSQKFDHLNGLQLVHWVVEETKKRGGEIYQSAAQLLVDGVGSDMWRISGIIDQLIAYCSGNSITIKEVHLFVEKSYDDSIFTLVDSIITKNPKKVFGMLRQQYSNGKDATYVFAMVLRQVKILLQMRDVFEQEDTLQSAALAKRLSLHPFVVKKTLPIMRKHTMTRLVALHKALLGVDIGIKTGAGDPKLLVDVFVGEWCVAK